MSASDDSAASPTQGDGLRPSLAELVALRRSAHRLAPARRGRLGHAGSAPAPMRGRGMEYAESREYVAGDDARHIDWRVTARTGRAHTKLFQAERERLTLLVADTDPVLYFGTRVRFKSVQAARVGAIAAWLAQRQGDRLGALRGSTVEAPLAPAGGTRGVLRVLDALTRWYAQPPADDAGLDRALEHAARLLRPGARVVVLADPTRAAAISVSRWTALALHHEVLVMLLVDPLELAPPSAALAFQSQGRRVLLDLHSAGVREHWRQRFVAPLEELQRTLASRRIQVHVVASDDASDCWLGALPSAVVA
ncbi:DUF58 domain-containing protein [Stenotrophomonas rhizophila]|uniref:DUF58 domain-containing protein n=1 Tax=Stenotrophomonas rhizophila TaxID=216778 RepID=UPI001E2B42D6|nr:DUF58 domain-containing protein [Stenotrophomonas rhizophila]MCC7636009.1 DUF58 domain-containing protein [Stenotrophomonas rhizophila]MCC7665357.1 DUF58 domain-containing protein [Stenotrophomonas rhizophila]